jgi:NTP pyrophosphatase (non-canonical NTP hydrolase)
VPSDEASPDQALIKLAPLVAALERFASERDWEQFHSPKNLVMALSGEVGELSAIFQWMTEAQSKTAGTDPSVSQSISEELADVLLYLVRLASVLGIDLNEATKRKLEINAEKYPVDRYRGSSRKYTEP